MNIAVSYDDDLVCDVLEWDDYKISGGYLNIMPLTHEGTITYDLTGGIGGPLSNHETLPTGTNVQLSTVEEPTHEPADLDGEIVDVMFIGWSLTEPRGILTFGDIMPELVTYVTIIGDENIIIYAVWGFDIGIIVEVDEDGNAIVAIPPWIEINYETSEDNYGNITVIFPLNTDKSRITVIVYSDWEYDITECDNGEVVVLLIPPPPVPIFYEVTFNLNGGNIARDTNAIVISVLEGEMIGDEVPTPVRASHRFNGWQENGGGQILNSADVAEIIVDNPLTFTALWTRINIAPSTPIVVLPPNNDDNDTEEKINDSDEPIDEPKEEPTAEEPIEEDLSPNADEPSEEKIPDELQQEEMPEDNYEQEPMVNNENHANDGDAEEPQSPEDIDVVENTEDTESVENAEDTENAEVTEDAENAEGMESDILEFILSGAGNPVNRNIRQFRIINRLSVGLQFLSGEIPAFTNGQGLVYTVKYRTNMTDSLRVMASNVPADSTFSLSPPQLNNGEYIIEIIIEFDTAPAGLRMDDTIIYRFTASNQNNVEYRWDITLIGESSTKSIMLTSISEILNFQNRYDAESWENLQTVISNVQAILDNPNATPQEIEMSYILLQQAINELTPVHTGQSQNMATEILIAFAILALVICLLVVLKKLLNYKKRLIANSWKRALNA